MEPRSDDFEAVLLADIHNAPMLTVAERAKRLRVPAGKINWALMKLEKRGIDDLKRLQMKVVSDVAKDMPQASATEIAKKIGASPVLVGFVLKLVEPRLQIEKRKSIARNAAQRKRSNEYKETRKELLDNIREMLIEKPFASWQQIRAELRCTYTTVQNVSDKLRKEGFYRDLEREILLSEYALAHPNATKKEAAEHFETNVFQITQTRGSSALRNSPPKNISSQLPKSSSGEDWPCNSEVDQEMEAQLYLRPAWYVEEVRKNGFLGVCLPENEFKLYLELREKHRKQGSRIFMVERKSE